MLSAFGAAALALSALGIFGLVSYLVRRQRREIGVRLALGAEPSTILRMVLARGMRYVMAGTLVGLGLTAVSGRWLRASRLPGFGRSRRWRKSNRPAQVGHRLRWFPPPAS